VGGKVGAQALATMVASVYLTIGHSSIASKTYSCPMNPFVVEEPLCDEDLCDNGMVQDSANRQPLRHHLTRLPPRELCRKIGAWHETLIERPSSSKCGWSPEVAGVETHRGGFADSVLTACDIHGWDMRPVREGARTSLQNTTSLPEHSQVEAPIEAQTCEVERSLRPSSVNRQTCSREAAVHLSAQTQAPWTRRSCTRATGRALQRFCGRIPLTTAYGGPAPAPIPRRERLQSNKASRCNKRNEVQENDPKGASKKQQQAKNVIVENVRGAAYTRAPARTAGMLKMMLRHASAKCLNRSENHSRSKGVAFSSW